MATAPRYTPPAVIPPYPVVPRTRCDQCGGSEGPFKPARFLWGLSCACPKCIAEKSGVLETP